MLLSFFIKITTFKVLVKIVKPAEQFLSLDHLVRILVLRKKKFIDGFKKSMN